MDKANCDYEADFKSSIDTIYNHLSKRDKHAKEFLESYICSNEKTPQVLKVKYHVGYLQENFLTTSDQQLQQKIKFRLLNWNPLKEMEIQEYYCHFKNPYIKIFKILESPFFTQ